MIKRIFFIAFALFFLGCNDDTKSHKIYDAKALLLSKCSSCHDVSLPPKLSKEELAPPMMAVSHHVFNMIKVKDETQRVPKSIAFVKDYVMAPLRSKSFCDKESLDRYGIMPSQKDNVTQAELESIASYMFRHFTQKNLTQAQEAQQRFNAMSYGEKLAHKYNCFGCHKTQQQMVGPSFEEVAKRYKDSTKEIIYSIENGSKGKWAKAIMPPFKRIDKKELDIITHWIITL